MLNLPFARVGAAFTANGRHALVALESAPTSIAPVPSPNLWPPTHGLHKGTGAATPKAKLTTSVVALNAVGEMVNEEIQAILSAGYNDLTHMSWLGWLDTLS